ncbi:MAG: elongation factor Ts [Chitinophagales bacterium]|nr:elongation factor Ts [Bacteroidota bacterium]MCB9256330.1 elongation factor Ts [Chitinophagales bacterium]
MAITAQQVNELRKQTGAGLMDCKKALTESNGDMQGAIDYLRKKGAKLAEIRSGRDANEGAVIAKTSADGTRGVIVHLACETDFVAKNEEFIKFANELADIALDNKVSSKEELENLKYADTTVKDKVAEKVGTIGENISISNFATISGDNIAAYIHAGNKIGVLVSYKDGGKADAASFFRGVSMHIAAMKPKILSYKEFEADFIAKETEAFKNQIITENEERVRLGKHLKNVPRFVSMVQLTPEVMEEVKNEIRAELKAEGKPEQIWDKILPGKVERFVADNTLLDQEYCLLDQFFALDDSKTVAKAIEDFSKDAAVVEFARVELGS